MPCSDKADASLEMEQRHFVQASLEYVFRIQEVQERKKFEFVEILLGFMFGWLTFYHQAYEVAEDFNPYRLDLQFRIQKTRDNFNATRDQTESLMRKMLEMRQQKPDSGSSNKVYSREGYLYLMEKKAFGTTWTKHYCMYQRDNKEFIMIPYNQMTGKFNTTEKMILASCVRRMSDSIEKRFCFDLTPLDRPSTVYTLQALSEEDRKLWMDVMDGKEPTYGLPAAPLSGPRPEERALDETGFVFVRKCIEVVEARGLEEQGLYRVVGVASKVSKLLSMGLDRRKFEKLNLEDAFEWESKTITSALKTYLRNLHEPLMTFRYHSHFIAAAKEESRSVRINCVHTLAHKLNFNMLDILVKHLTNVAAHCDKNLMTVSNLGVCFGPTLLRPEEETVAAIMDIKFCNVVVEILIENYNRIFKQEPPPPQSRNASPVPSSQSPPISKIYQTPPPVTHTVIKSYYDGPLLSTSLHNVATAAAHINTNRPPTNNISLPSSQPRRTNNVSSYASESNLHLTNHNKPCNIYYSDLLNSEVLNSTGSSSNESVASLPSTINTSPPGPGLVGTNIPVKNKRGSTGLHYASSYRPPQDTVISTGACLGRTCISYTSGVRRVRTLFACLGENDGELSFEPNQIITNVRTSLEPGWLEGTLNGKTGLVPENYVELLP
uniref:Rho GTPase-activating protein 10 n=1 Tax=Cacopsylla melanoneura TaxID=428564 RepID=A0A8D9DSX2_9HEMI